jgi:hypothetical protein
MVSSRVDSHSKEEASTLEVAREEGKGVGRTEGQDLQPQGKEWRAKTTPQAEAVKPLEEAVKPPEAVKPADQAVRPGSLEMSPGFTFSVLMACDDKLLSVPVPKDDEQLIDYSSSPKRMDLEDNGEGMADFNENRP